MKIQWQLLVVSAALAFTSACNDNKLTAAAVAGEKPTAVITGSQAYGPLDTATFDGSSSTAVSPKTITGYDWSISARPSGSQSQVVVGAPSSVTFFVDLAGDYKVKLKVTDSEGLTDTTEYAFSAVPSQSLHVELTWPAQYGQADMDLHLINKTAPGAALWSPQFDCDFMTCKPTFGMVLDWGVPGETLDNPTLDIDNIIDFVPENINIKKPADGTYEVDVHYYASHGAGTVANHIRIYLAGQIAWEGDMNLNSANQVWAVADVVWANGQGTVTPINTIFTTTSH